jgi:hypothetical protein
VNIKEKLCLLLLSDFSKSVQTQCSKLSFPEVHLLTDLDLVTWDLSHYKNKVFKIYLGQLVRYGTEIIKGVGIPQSGQVILLTIKNLFYEHNLLLPTGSYCRVSDGDFVANNSPLLTLIKHWTMTTLFKVFLKLNNF